VGGTVFGHVNVIESDTGDDAKVTSSGGMDRIRIDGSGEAGDGAFGGYIRLDNGDIDSANAWWKPIDQFKLIIGNNSDGFWAKEGVTGWMFNQMPYDSGIAINPGTWYGEYGGGVMGGGGNWGSCPYGGPYMHSRYVFFEGVGDSGALMEITPADMVGINVYIPFIREKEKEAAVVFKNSVAQLDLKLDFGNIAITYDGGGRGSRVVGAGGAIYAYFGGSFGDLGLDVGFSYHLSGDPDNEKALWLETDAAQPIGVGLGVKYATDSFGVKFRTIVALAGDDEGTYINASLLPYFTLSDSLSAFVNVGLGMTMPGEGDSVTGWYFNPYLRVGAEWGPTFYFGIKAESAGGDDAIIKWAIPVSLMVSF